jgi:simple sugar transport system permease protein
MLNYVAGCVILFLVQGPLKEGYLPQSASLPMGALMGPLAEGGRLHAGPFLALAIALAMAFVMRATAWGFQLRAVGLDARAARAAGMRVSLTQALAFVASGALAGLAGGVELAAVYGRLTNNMCPGYGFLALAAAILARARPVAVLAAAALFGALLVGGDYAERAVGAPKQAIFIFQGVFVMVFAAVEGRLGPAD